MSDTNGRAPAPVDADGALDFTDEAPPVPRYPAETATIEARSPEGLKVTWTLYDPIPGAVSRRIAAVMKQGYTPTTDAPAGTRATEAGTVVSAQGEAPICPVHAPRRMKASNYGGWFCTWGDDKTGEKCKEKVK